MRVETDRTFSLEDKPRLATIVPHFRGANAGASSIQIVKETVPPRAGQHYLGSCRDSKENPKPKNICQLCFLRRYICCCLCNKVSFLLLKTLINRDRTVTSACLGTLNVFTISCESTKANRFQVDVISLLLFMFLRSLYLKARQNQRFIFKLIGLF